MENVSGFNEASLSPGSVNKDDGCAVNLVIIYLCVLVPICLFCLICNLFSLLVLHRMHDMHEVTKLLLVALTITDVGVGVFGLLDTTLKLWVATANPIFALVEFCQLLGLCTLALITAVRYVAVSQPLKLQTLVTKQRAYIGLTCAFFICILNSVPYLILQYAQEYSNQLDILSLSVFLAVITLLIVSVIILYGKLLLIARHQARRIAATEINAEDAQVQLQRSNVKSLKTFLIITGTVCLTWLPTFALIDNIGKVNPCLWAFLDALHYSSSWLNTVIYCWRNDAYRTVAKKLICRNSRQ